MAVVLFDGVCLLCDRLVGFLLAHDRHRRLRFAALQSDPGRALLERLGVAAPAGEPQTVYLVEGERLRERSDAILRALVLLGLPWSLAGACYLVPKPLRDGAYRFVARHRSRWFGRADACRRPTPEERARFLE